MDQVITDSLLRQGIIIAGAVTFKEIRYVEGWFNQQAHTDQVKQNHQASRAMRITMFESQIRLLRPLSHATS